ncbi:94_t:CDS:2, partial [Dentiscutata heterogama]
MSSSSNYSNTFEDCSKEENLQTQLENDIYISDLEKNSIEVEQKEIIQSIQDISFQESISTDEENLTKNFELLLQVKLFKNWQIYEDLIILLEQFNEATIELSSQKYPTIAHVQIILLALRNDLESDKGENFLLEE